MKRVKRWLAMLMAMVMMFTLISAESFAAGVDTEVETSVSGNNSETVDDTVGSEDISTGSPDVEVVADEAQTKDSEYVNHTILINYLFEDGDTAAKSWSGSLAAGTSYEATVANPVIIGYTPTEPTAVPEGIELEYSEEKITFSVENIQGDISVDIVYKPAMVNYTVKYYLQNVNDDDYTLADTVTMQGLTASNIAVTYNSEKDKYTGFYGLQFDENVKIAADGSTEVEIYYNRNYYLMYFDLSGGHGVDPIFARYGAAIGNVGTPERAGYTFRGWDKTIPATMPAENTTYKAVWNAGNTNFTVVFWYENANDDGYTYVGSIVTNATAGSTVSSGSYQNTNFTGRDATHFTYNSDMAETKVVEGDGSTVLNVYFTRNVYTLRFQSDSGSNSTLYGTITAKYQAEIVDLWPVTGETMVGGTTRVPSNVYSWRYTKTGASSMTTVASKIFTMNADVCDSGSSRTKVFTAYPGGGTKRDYDINYYLESLTGTGTQVDGVYYELSEKYSEIDKPYADNPSNWNYKTIDGFYYTDSDGKAPINNSNNTGYYANLYYRRNQNDIVFYDNYGTTVAEVSGVMFEMPLSNVTYNGNAISMITPDYPAGEPEGTLEFAGWYTSAGCYDGTEADFENGIMPDANLAFYAKWVPIQHEVKIYDDVTLGDQIGDTQDVSHDSYAKAPDTPENGNYVFIGWFYKDENGVEKAFDFASMPITRDMVIYAKWNYNVLVPYTVNYVLADGTVIADQLTGVAMASSTKTFEAKAGENLYAEYQEGYFPTVRSHSITMDVEGDNVVTFVYRPVPNVPYTVKYLNSVTNRSVAPDKVVDPNKLSVVTETAVTVSGYLPDAFQKRLVLSIPEGVSEPTPEDNVIIFYYTEDVRHALVTETHYTVNGQITSIYSQSTVTGDIGANYSRSPKEIDGYVLDYILVNGVEWTSSGDPSARLTADGLHFEFYYKYNRFNVYHQSDSSIETLDMVDVFDITAKVKSGYLYGGVYTDQTFTNPDADLYGLNIEPVAGATYYLKEVPESYLCPKIYYQFDKRDNNKIKNIYLVTAIDDEHYQYVGFDIDGENLEQAITDTTVYESVAITNYNTATGAYEAGRTENLGLSYFFGSNPSSGLLNVQKYNNNEAGTVYSFSPYFVTPDGIKVTGVKERTVYLGNGTFAGSGTTGLHVSDITHESEVSPYTAAELQPMLLSVRSALAIDFAAEPEVQKFVITKYNGNAVTEQVVEAGNQVGNIEYTAKKGYMFAGWYTDKKLTKPADFSDVQKNMTVYAKYISAGSVDVSVGRTGKSGNTVKLCTIISVNTDDFAKVGFVYDFKGSSEAIPSNRKSVDILGSLLSSIFSFSIQYRYDYSGDFALEKLSSRDTFTVTPYWVTEDGTTVYGTARNYMYYSNTVYER